MIDHKVRMTLGTDGDGSREIIGGFCRDCRWVQGPSWAGRLFGGIGSWEFAKCLSPRNPTDLVTGKPKESFCDIQRAAGQCGRPGHWFEARERGTN
jgi:hypothetical protein